ncbi:hypothetical protein SS50377_20531 [Spironucleus salmonicida]|uniref:Uncharacterized protein n=1 Tax=Spironucleus salmonicida TaxID=348837 RepID=V6LJD6_9EUKA|nr:hypothetical protein SS50377_20531 [Spironucleus salmonicida]|eukprot:EST43821.1 Hypothetical protein SS50377_16442 [Spironucleus salmonicida]
MEEFTSIKQILKELKDQLPKFPQIDIEGIQIQLIQFSEEHELALMQNEDQGHEIISLHQQLDELNDRFREKMHNKTEQNEYLQEKRAELISTNKTMLERVQKFSTDLTTLKQDLNNVKLITQTPLLINSPKIPFQLQSKLHSQLQQIDQNEKISRLEVRIQELLDDKNELIEEKLRMKKQLNRRTLIDSVTETQEHQQQDYTIYITEIDNLKAQLGQKPNQDKHIQCDISKEEINSLNNSLQVYSNQIKTLQSQNLHLQQRSELLETNLTLEDIPQSKDYAAEITEKDLKISQLIEQTLIVNDNTEILDGLRNEIQRQVVAEKRLKFKFKKETEKILSKNKEIETLKQEVQNQGMGMIKYKKLINLVMNLFDIDDVDFSTWNQKLSSRLGLVENVEYFKTMNQQMETRELKLLQNIDLLQNKVNITEKRGTLLLNENLSMRNTMSFKSKQLQNLENKYNQTRIDYDQLQISFNQVKLEKGSKVQNQESYNNLEEYYKDRENKLKQEIFKIQIKLKQIRPIGHSKPDVKIVSTQTSKAIEKSVINQSQPQQKSTSQRKITAQKSFDVEMHAQILLDETLAAEIRAQAGIEIWRQISK